MNTIRINTGVDPNSPTLLYVFSNRFEDPLKNDLLTENFVVKTRVNRREIGDS